MKQLDLAQASHFARIALGHVQREYPNILVHVLHEPGDALPPRVLHPIFYGSFDWHSCVHGYWLLLRLLRTFPDLPEAAAIRDLAEGMLVPEKVSGELAYLQRPGSGGFERPYGWAWLLKLHAELVRHRERRWANALQPLARAFAARFRDHLPKLTYPIRTGTHFNTAFAIVLALDWADRFDAPLAALMRERAAIWYGGDRDAPCWEPGGDDFLSPILTVALCMQRVLPEAGYRDWLRNFLPQLSSGKPAVLFEPEEIRAAVIDMIHGGKGGNPAVRLLDHIIHRRSRWQAPSQPRAQVRFMRQHLAPHPRHDLSSTLRQRPLPTDDCPEGTTSAGVRRPPATPLHAAGR